MTCCKHYRCITEVVLHPISIALENFIVSLSRRTFHIVQDPATLNDVYVKNNLGEMVPVNTVVTLQRVYGPETVFRNNLFNSVTLNGLPSRVIVRVMP